MKFKKGDWIKNHYGDVFLVLGIEGDSYLLRGADGDESLNSIKIVDKSSHLIDTQNEMKVAFHKGYITALENMEKVIKELKNRINYDKTSIGTNPSEVQGEQADNG